MPVLMLPLIAAFCRLVVPSPCVPSRLKPNVLADTIVDTTADSASSLLLLTPERTLAYAATEQALARYWAAHQMQLAQARPQPETVPLAAGMTATLWTVNYPRMVRQDTVIARMFAEHHFDPAQFVPTQLAVYRALSAADTEKGADTLSILGRNIALVQSHRAVLALDWSHIQRLTAAIVPSHAQSEPHSTLNNPAFSIATLGPDVTTRAMTPTVLAKLAFMLRELRRHPAHLHALLADSAHYTHVLRRERLVSDTLEPLPGAGTLDALLDLGRLAQRDPLVASAFKRAHLSPKQYLPDAEALQEALALDAVDALQLFPVAAADSATQAWRNVRVVRAHRGNVYPLATLLPPVEITSLGPVVHFLDTTRTPPTIRLVAARNPRGGEPWPWGYLDSVDAPHGSRTSSAPPYRVLFIGNSLTYVNGLPRLFSVLAAHGLRRRVVAGLVSLPGVSPEELWTETDLRRVLAILPWDAVVVQLKPAEDSMRTAVEFPYFAQLFAHAIQAVHARALFWSEWASPPEAKDRQARNARLASAWRVLTASAHDDGATVVPIPQARAAVLQQDSLIWLQLFANPLDSHPRPPAAYLNALVVYQTLTGRSPMGLPASTAPVADPVHGVITFPPHTAAVLQRAAVAAHASAERPSRLDIHSSESAFK